MKIKIIKKDNPVIIIYNKNLVSIKYKQSAEYQNIKWLNGVTEN
jgi:hypothetical protein